MGVQQNIFPLRLSPEIMQKIKLLAALHKRSANKEIEFLLSAYLDEYEQTHGPLSPSP